MTASSLSPKPNPETQSKRLAFLLIALSLFVFAIPGSSRPFYSECLVILHVTVIDATGADAKPDQTVVIRDGRIIKIGNADRIAMPDKSTVLDAQGKFLIPGLWDMHVHTLHSARPQTFFAAFIANGITGVRDMGSPVGELEDVVRLRMQIEAGTALGPRLVVAGPLLDGPHPIFPELSVAVSNASEARQAVRDLQGSGVDFIKVYSLLGRDAYFAIAEESRERGIPFAGHVPEAVSAREASDAGQRSIEHLSGIRLGCSTIEAELRQELINARAKRDASVLYQAFSRVYARSRETYSQDTANLLFRRFVTNETWQVPTLVVSRFVARTDSNTTSQKTLLSNDLGRKTAGDPYLNDAAVDQSESVASTQSAIDLVSRMRQLGVKFMAGTDTPNPFVVPGQSLHEELELLVQAGFTTMQVLQTATRNPAEYLGRLEMLGTVEVGKIADLVLLDANPLEDIRNTRKIRAVLLNGKIVTSAVE